MTEIFIETDRLVISPLTESNYESITKLYDDLKAAGMALDVFGRLPGDNVEKGLELAGIRGTSFNLAAKSKDKNEFIGYLKGSLTEEGALWIYILAVDAQKRRLGYGTEIVKALVDYARASQNAKFASLSVIESNKNAKIFWESLDFAIDKTLIKSGVTTDMLSKINIYVKLF